MVYSDLLEKLPSRVSSSIQSMHKGAARPKLLQLVGAEGSGARRFCFDFLSTASSTLWMSPQWRIYAPLLWQIAEEKQIELIGLECPQAKSWRNLWREIFEAQVFDFWVLDNFKLRAAEGFFLQKLVRKSPLKIIVIDSTAHNFCQKRLHINLNHQHYRFFWTKGGSLKNSWKEATYLKELKEDLCTL